MKIFRKDQTKPIKDESQKAQEELTDISIPSAPLNTQKEKMEEIYSTKDKHVKYKRQTPLEAEREQLKAQQAKEKLIQGKAEIALEDNKEQEQIVELAPEFDESAVIAEDIIEDVEGLNKGTRHKIHDIDSIDIELNPADAIKKYERQVNQKDRFDERQKIKSQGDFERLFGKPTLDINAERIVEKIPKYQHDSKINKLKLKAGKFTEVVESEYDEYLKSHDPTISNRHPSQIRDIPQNKSLIYALSQMTQRKAPTPKQSPKQIEQKPAITNKPANPNKVVKKKKTKLQRVLSSVIPKKTDSSKDYQAKTVKAPIDYQSRQDLKHVSNQIYSHFKKLTGKTVTLAVLFAITLFLCGMEAGAGNSLFGSSKYSALIFCGINLVAMIITGFVARSFIISGLKPLRQFKGNSDTAVSTAYCICLLQNIIAMFFADRFIGGDLHLYTPIVILAFALNTTGRLVMVSRVKENFKFLTSKSPAYAAKIFKDEDTARKMLSGTAASHSIIAYQHPTDFLSDFLKISYAPDTSEESTGKLAPITILCSVFVAIIYGIISKSIIGLLCAFAVMCCISTPICALLCGNVPLKLFCMEALEKGAMLTGYPSVKQFSDSNAVMIDASDLYPKGNIKLKSIEEFSDYRIDESMLMAACILKEANNPMYHIFDDLLKENAHNLPNVESVLYEDKLGLIGWVSGERVLIGNRKLLDRFNVYIDSDADESKYKKSGREVTYIACAGQLMSMLITDYVPNEKIKEELQRSEANGLCLVVSTTDCNVTVDKISEDFELFYRCVKVLSTGYSNMCTHYRTQKEETSRAYLATRGKMLPLLRAISGCVKLKRNITMGNIIQIFGLLLGVLLCATMVLYANVAILGVFEILLYMLFWSAAAIIAQLVQRP